MSWIVVNTTGLLDAVRFPDTRIPGNRRPSYIHTSKETAETEMLRLAQETGDTFALFECVAETRGTIFSEKVVYRIEEVKS